MGCPRILSVSSSILEKWKKECCTLTLLGSTSILELYLGVSKG